MVECIDIHSLTLEELSGIVELYPWFAGARVELCQRMAKLGILSSGQLSQTALHLSSRRILSGISSGDAPESCADSDAQSLVRSYISERSPRKKQVYVVGGDYFSQEQYNEAGADSGQSDFSAFVHSTRSLPLPAVASSESGADDFCTETLAQIYLSQDYTAEAIAIYSKLSLRYPEKSIYFASLIDEIKQKTN